MVFKVISNDGQIYYPHNMDNKAKIKLKDTGIMFYCACNDFKIEFKINTKGAFYSAKHNVQDIHHPSCPKSKRYQQKKEYNKGFQFDEENCSISAVLSESIKESRPVIERQNEQHDQERGQEINRRQYPRVAQGEISISALIKNMNMFTFKHVSFHHNKENPEYSLPDSASFISRMYYTEKITRIGRMKKSLADLKTSQDGYSFIYEEYLGIEKAKKEKSYDRIVANKLVVKDGVKSLLTIPVKKEALILAIDEFRRTYHTDDFSNKKLVFAGFRNKYAIYNLHFIWVNDFGLFSESSYEVQMYNYICGLLSKYELKKEGAHFYKPYEYGFGAYGDRYLEDGIIEFDHCNQKIIIEVYGRNDEEYLERKKLKEQIISQADCVYHYISWNAYVGEPLPKESIKKEILEILQNQ